MTDFTYDVLYRPKKGKTGRTNVGWAAECGREAVQVGGYLVTRRASKGEPKTYTAFMTKQEADGTMVELYVGNDFETRAQAAFAIWRKYYEPEREARERQKAAEEAERKRRREERIRKRAFRQTPEGQKAYREELNAKARARRAAMTPEQKAEEARKRRKKRERKHVTY